MNGSKSTFKRKGYWLTAFAAAVLLAASPGTASAQVEITGPDEVTEGGTATYTVSVKGYIQPTSAAGTLTVTLPTPVPTALSGDEDKGTNGETTDFPQSAQSPLTFIVEVDAGPNTGEAPATFSASGVIRLQTLHDPDAEDEDFTIAGSGYSVVAASGVRLTPDEDGTTDTLAVVITGDDAAPTKLTIEDDETQTYEFKLTTDEDEVMEGAGESFNVEFRAKPNLAENEEEDFHVRGPSGYTFTSGGIPIPTEGLSLGSDAVGGEDPTVRTIVVGTPTNDGNRDDDVIMLEALTGSVTKNEVIGTSDPITVLDMVVDKDGKILDPQPTSVPEGESVMVAVMSYNEDGDPMDADEQLTVALRPTRHVRFGGLHVGRDAHHRARRYDE